MEFAADEAVARCLLRRHGMDRRVKPGDDERVAVSFLRHCRSVVGPSRRSLRLLLRMRRQETCRTLCSDGTEVPQPPRPEVPEREATGPRRTCCGRCRSPHPPLDPITGAVPCAAQGETVRSITACCSAPGTTERNQAFTRPSTGFAGPPPPLRRGGTAAAPFTQAGRSPVKRGAVGVADCGGTIRSARAGARGSRAR
jgi:hypothetical protein